MGGLRRIPAFRRGCLRDFLIVTRDPSGYPSRESGTYLYLWIPPVRGGSLGRLRSSFSRSRGMADNVTSPFANSDQSSNPKPWRLGSSARRFLTAAGEVSPGEGSGTYAGVPDLRPLPDARDSRFSDLGLILRICEHLHDQASRGGDHAQQLVMAANALKASVGIPPTPLVEDDTTASRA